MQNQNTQKETEAQPPLLCAPAKVRRHGLRDAHSRPLVAKGKDRHGSFRGSFRVAPQDAWNFPSIELRAGNSYPALILDLDGEDAALRWSMPAFTGELPEPSWAVRREKSGGVHVVYCLAYPVHRGAKAREAPLKKFSKVAEYYAEFLEADAGYAGVLTHNPMAKAHRPGTMKTSWGRKEPYSLDDLARIIPLGWNLPVVPKTAVGRNCALFSAMGRWAGSESNIGHSVLAAATAANQQFEFPLPVAEVRSVSRSVEKFRQRLIANGAFYSGQERSAYGAMCGRLSGAARRKATADRDAAIMKAVLDGQSMRSVAKDHGLAEGTVRWILNRDPMSA